MPPKDDAERGKGDPPTPSSPMWLPSLAHATPGALRPKQTLSKTRTLPSAGNTLKSGIELLSPQTLPSLEAFDIPGRKRQRDQVSWRSRRTGHESCAHPNVLTWSPYGCCSQKGTAHSTVPRLPAIPGGSSSLIRSKAGHDAPGHATSGHGPAHTDPMDTSDMSDGMCTGISSSHCCSPVM
jgi:hypothetical protein